MKLSHFFCSTCVLLAATAPCFIACQAVAQQSRQVGEPGDETSNFSGPLKIVKLLWKANPKGASDTLIRSIQTALQRHETDKLRTALETLRAETELLVIAADVSDRRYAVSLAVDILLQDQPPDAVRLGLAIDELDETAERELLWRVWLVTDPATADDYLRVNLEGGSKNSSGNSWRSVMIREALAVNRRMTTQALLGSWNNLQESERLAAIEPLTANAESMEMLLTAVRAGNISKDLINPNQLRKWLASDNSALTKNIESIWGKIRQGEDLARQRLVAQVLTRLQSPVTGSASRGSLVFDRVCSQCHVLHGRGFEVGPNIVGNGRGSLQQLVSNILDPSLVIGEAFQATTVLTVDGQVVSGLLTSESDRYLKLKIQGGKVTEFDKEDIEQLKVSDKSLMPEGVESQMKEQELFDLLAYLSLLNPGNADDNELIPGTPEGFVQP